MVRRACWMRHLATRTHWRSKTKPPDPVLGNRALTENLHIFGGWLLSKHGRPRRFRPNPQPRTFLGTSPRQPWVISPVGCRGRSYSHSLRCPPEVRNWGVGIGALENHSYG